VTIKAELSFNQPAGLMILRAKLMAWISSIPGISKTGNYCYS
jgi:hypothetical protein